MRCAPVGNECLFVKIVVQHFGEVTPSNFTHGARMQVWYGKHDRLSILATEEEVDLRDKDLFSYIPEELLHAFRAIGHMSDECIDEGQSPYAECAMERTLD